MVRLMLFGKLWDWERLGILEYDWNLSCVILVSLGFAAVAFFEWSVLLWCFFLTAIEASKRWK